MGQKPAGVRERLDAEEWSRFWERGTLTTFEGHFSENYDAEIRDFWWSQFERLGPDAAVVDLATGNGAVALLAARFARENDRVFSITGVDSAAIDPARIRAAWPALAPDIDAIALRGGVPLEATGLADGSVDLVTSQYGFEYGDTAAGSREIARILRPGGRVAMIVHHADSAILSQAREGLRQVSMCVAEERFLRLGRRMTKLFRGLKPGPQRGGLNWTPGAVKVREELMAAAARLERHARRPEVLQEDAGFLEFVVPAVLRLLEQARGSSPANLERAWGEIEGEAEAYRLRMSDLVSAARDEAGMAQVQAEMEAAGLAPPAAAPLRYRGETLLGWTLVTHRP
ncbi:class I SAM-dependent methyltransferase [Thioalkalivibrio sp. XN279]|uniref:class I SAM-dependent methyltransferase n=1 Tax=Thioalkalivibrio sp. XN279 TaxID=2714953 RepID=UPI00140E91C1|nr:class I SAM-dependent methyltransferase [Thioalkalivibrio sp. XN279]NHA13520.1 class I SAM-dependent methyltransferase [Thioalkalivibrio sp. XN279]